MRSLCLEANHLKKTYGGRVVVNDVSLKVNQGEVAGLLGHNGAGKTTSFYMMVGLVQADEGRILLDGTDITEFPIHVRAIKGIGYLPQEASVFRDLSVELNIYAVLENRKLPRYKKLNLLNSLMRDFGLEKVKNSYGRTLSGGERRRVEIARTLAMEPKFILLDEPFAGVDPKAISDIQEIIKGLKKRNIGVLITDHNARETLKIVDYAYVMNSGSLLVSGTPDEIVKNDQAKKYYLGEDFRM